MKKYARLRQDCSEFDNALYNASPERPSIHDATSGAEFFQPQSQSRPPASSDGSASPQRDSPPALRLARPPAPTTNGPSHTDLTDALQKLASYREGGSSRRGRHNEPWQGVVSNGERSASARWPVHSPRNPEWDPQEASGQITTDDYDFKDCMMVQRTSIQLILYPLLLDEFERMSIHLIFVSFYI